LAPEREPIFFCPSLKKMFLTVPVDDFIFP